MKNLLRLLHRGGHFSTTRFVAEVWPHPLSGNHLARVSRLARAMPSLDAVLNDLKWIRPVIKALGIPGTLRLSRPNDKPLLRCNICGSSNPGCQRAGVTTTSGCSAASTAIARASRATRGSRGKGRLKKSGVLFWRGPEPSSGPQCYGRSSRSHTTAVAVH
jgi:hypothetical protein